MTSFRHLSLSNKLLSVFMITTGSALVLACAVILLYDLLLYRESVVQELYTQADIIGANSANALVNRDTQAAAKILNALRFQPSITQAAIYQMDGSVLATYSSTVEESDLSPMGAIHSSWLNFTSYSLVREIIHDGERIGSIYIQSSFGELFHRWTGFVGIVLGVMFASTLFALVLSTRFQKIISDPILRLTSLAKRISQEKNYALRETAASRDEIGTLVTGINDMLEQIQERDRQLEHHKEELEEEVDKRTAELAQVHQQVRLILETAGDGIFGVDTGGRLTFVNPAAARMLHLAPESMIGQSIHAMAHYSKPDGAPYPIEESPIYRSFTEGREFNVDDEVLWRPDGTSFQVEYTSTPMRNGDDALIGAVVTFRDITERRLAEKALLEAKQAAEHASRAKSQFLANMSHEIRTPMSGVLGMTEVLLKSSLSSRQKHYAETVLRSSRNLLRILNDILDFSKMEARKLELEALEFPLHRTLEDAVEFFAEMAQGKHLELVAIIDPHLPESAVGDPGRLTQVLNNLIGNGLKFTSQGEVILRAALDSQCPDSFQIHIEVRDSGIGISAAVQEQIFDPFSQADGSTTREYGGTGLGLAISKDLVELMGGKLGVSSDGHHGSSFFFTIPLGYGSHAQGSPPDIPFSKRSRTLLIEDHEPTRALITTWLEQWGMTVAHAGTGEAALQMLRERTGSTQPFDFVIIDHTLPDVSGLELMPHIAAHAAQHPPHCLLLAPWHMSDMESQHSFANGLQALVHKPLRRLTLYEALFPIQEHRRGRNVSTDAPPAPVSPDRSSPRILLADDYAVNQEIVKAMAEHLHFTLDIVNNGQEALDALRHSTYDLILMDWQMPVMDGLTTCLRIRNQGIQGRHQAYLPIIAFTALNTQEDHDKCVAAGINDTLPKPCTMEQFQAMLAKWVPSIQAAGLPQGVTASPVEPASDFDPPIDHTLSNSLDLSVLDRIKAMQRPGGPDIVAKVLTTYLTNTPKLLNDLREGAAQQDATRIRRAAHPLKSSSASIGAIRLADLCRELEERAKADNLMDADRYIHHINAEYESVKPALSALCTEDVHG